MREERNQIELRRSSTALLSIAASVVETLWMDMSGPMPRRVIVEIYNEADELAATLEAKIKGGAIISELPAFPSDTRGRYQEIWIYANGERSVADRSDLEELPAEPTVMIAQVG